MPALREVQRRVMDALHASGEPAPDVVNLLRETRGLAASQRLQVYRNNWRESLIAALQAVFPVTQQLVGDAWFRQVARAFLADHPLRAAHLHAFGREWPAFLRSLSSHAQWPYLADVAALEWAWHEVYHEAECDPLSASQLGDVPAARLMDLGLQLIPAARLVDSRYPVVRIWQAHQPGSEADLELSLDDGGVRIMVLRRDLEIEFVLLGESEFRWLHALASDASLADATLVALALDPAFDLGGCLGRHLALGSFAALPKATPALADQS